MADDAVQQRTGEDLERAGLIVHSYDSLFAIRKRIRKISDIVIPIKGGLGTNQLGVGVVTFIVMVVIYGLVLVPAMSLMGIEPHILVAIAVLLGPPILVGQRIAKPMPHGKSIPSSVTSFLRRYLDDPIHRRGNPITTPKQPADMAVLHYHREWQMFPDFAMYAPGELDVTDDDTESRFVGERVNLQDWYDEMALTHHDEMLTERTTRSEVAAQEIGGRRDRASRVILPTTPEDED